MATNEEHIERTHSRQAGTDNTNRILDDSPDRRIDIRPTGILVGEALDDDGAVGASDANEATEQKDGDELDFAIQAHLQPPD